MKLRAQHTQEEISDVTTHSDVRQQTTAAQQALTSRRNKSQRYGRKASKNKPNVNR